jgi:hypothetical protein
MSFSSDALKYTRERRCAPNINRVHKERQVNSWKASRNELVNEGNPRLVSRGIKGPSKVALCLPIRGLGFTSVYLLVGIAPDASVYVACAVPFVR